LAAKWKALLFVVGVLLRLLQERAACLTLRRTGDLWFAVGL
jgi:hypothetical protein